MKAVRTKFHKCHLLFLLWCLDLTTLELQQSMAATTMTQRLIRILLRMMEFLFTTHFRRHRWLWSVCLISKEKRSRTHQANWASAHPVTRWVTRWPTLSPCPPIVCGRFWFGWFDFNGECARWLIFHDGCTTWRAISSSSFSCVFSFQKNAGIITAAFRLQVYQFLSTGITKSSLIN